MTAPNGGRAKARIVLVEDHPVTREGFARLLEEEDGLEVCGLAGTVADALETVARAQPDLVITDIMLVGRNGLELIKELACRHPEVAVLVLSTHDESLYAHRALRAGAKGYVMKCAPTQRILEAIGRVLQGKVFLSEAMQERLLAGLAVGGAPSQGSEMDLLSDRELEVFELLGQGRSTAEIAAALKVHPSTVATHRTHIQQKLHLHSLSELVCRASEWVHSQAGRG